MTTVQKKLKLMWTSNPHGSMTLYGGGFSATVAPILKSTASGPTWNTLVTISSNFGGDAEIVYGGCLPEYGMRMAETFLFDRAIGIPHAQKALRKLVAITKAKCKVKP